MEHPILCFIYKYGEGIHHICLEVESIKATLSDLKEVGVRPLRDNVIEGSSKGRVIILNPNDAN
jgi:methylmalonyl-CoA/ethylmalonyl-CoA epimerase